MDTLKYNFDGRRGTHTQKCLKLIVTFGLCLAPMAATTTATDGFEGGSLNSFWSLEPGPGMVTLTTDAAHSGSQSLKIGASSTYPWYGGVIHDFGSEQFGSVSVYVQTGVLCCGSAAALSIQNNAGGAIASLQRTSDGGLVARFWPPGSSELPGTPVSGPLTGWHQLEVDSTPGGVTMKLDGTTVFTNPSVAKFRFVILDVWGGPGGSEYFDDFSASVGTAQPLYSTCLLYDATKAVKSGSTLPVKLDLCDSNGNDLSSSAITLHAISVALASTTISGIIEDAGNANPDNDFRFDSTLGSAGGYIFNLSTKGLTTGTYNLSFTVTGDSVVYTVPFQVK